MTRGGGWRGPRAAGRLLRAFLARRGVIEAPLLGASRRELDLIRETRSQVPLLLCDAAALQILICVRAAARLGGAMAEAGVLMGGSARLICEAKGDAPLHLFDTFELLQSPPRDSAGADEAELRSHFGGVHGRRDAVGRLLAAYSSVHVHAGIFPGTAEKMAEERFAFVHLDLDLVRFTREALAIIRPRMLPGGIIVGDDYDDPGVRETFRACFDDRGDSYFELPWGQVMIACQSETKIASG